jgi:hypothetical protein
MIVLDWVQHWHGFGGLWGVNRLGKTVGCRPIPVLSADKYQLWRNIFGITANGIRIISWHLLSLLDLLNHPLLNPICDLCRQIGLGECIFKN